MKKTPGKRLAKERKHTDASLIAERQRLDEVMAKGLLSTDQQVDASIRLSRLKADVVIAEERIERRPEGAADPGPEVAVALDTERAEVDAALKRQRQQERMAKATLFHQERAWTDARLQIERERTDLHFSEDAHRLNDLESTAPNGGKDAFLAVVSHDLKAPLGGIMMGIQLIADTEVDGAAGERLSHLTGMIRRAAAGMLLMINDLLDVERIGLDRFHMHITTHDLAGVVRESVESLRLVAKETGIELDCQLPESRAVAEFDRARLIQVLSNLLGNALKFTPRGGRISVTVTAQAGSWQVSVKDSGSGIPDTHLEEIFARYAQVQTNDRRGLGLGLYICRSIIDAHKGRIWAESHDGKGSAFNFTLPCCKDE